MQIKKQNIYHTTKTVWKITEIIQKNQPEGPTVMLSLFYLVAVTFVAGYTKKHAEKSGNWSYLTEVGHWNLFPITP